MKIVYNEAKAVREKKQKDAEIPQANKRAKIHNAFVVTIAVIVLIAASVGWFFVRREQLGSVGGILSFLVPLVIVYGMGVALVSCLLKKVVPNGKWYSANVQYYLITNGKKIIGHALEENEKGCVLLVTVEAPDKTITQESLHPYYLKKEPRVGQKEPLADLVNGTVYVPYDYRI